MGIYDIVICGILIRFGQELTNKLISLLLVSFLLHNLFGRAFLDQGFYDFKIFEKISRRRLFLIPFSLRTRRLWGA